MDCLVDWSIARESGMFIFLEQRYNLSRMNHVKCLTHVYYSNILSSAEERIAKFSPWHGPNQMGGFWPVNPNRGWEKGCGRVGNVLMFYCGWRALGTKPHLRSYTTNHVKLMLHQIIEKRTHRVRVKYVAWASNSLKRATYWSRWNNVSRTP